MKKNLILSLFIVFCFSAFSQNTNSLIIGIGPNKMSGDIGGNSFGSLLKDDLGYGAFLGYRHVFASNIGFRIFGNYESFRGKDTKAYNDIRKHFYSGTETGFGGQLEYVFIGNNYDVTNNPHSLYAFGGLKYVMYNSLLDNTTKEKGNTAGLFAGIGYQYRLSENFGVGVELKQSLYRLVQ